MAVHPAGGLVSGTLVNGLLHHFGHKAIELEVPDDDEEGDEQNSRNDVKTNHGHKEALADGAAEGVVVESKKESLSASLEALCLAGDDDSDGDEDVDIKVEHGAKADFASSQSMNVADSSGCDSKRRADSVDAGVPLPLTPPPPSMTVVAPPAALGMSAAKPIGSELRQGIVRPGIVHR